MYTDIRYPPREIERPTTRPSGFYPTPMQPARASEGTPTITITPDTQLAKELTLLSSLHFPPFTLPPTTCSAVCAFPIPLTCLDSTSELPGP